MSDTKLRDLERRWRETGTVDDEAAYLQERVRVGEISSDTLKLAAYCGHNGAVAASGVSVGPPVQSIDRGHTDQRNAEQSVVEWLRGLRALGQVPWITAIAASLAPIVAAAGERRVRAEISSRLDRALSLLEKPHPFIELSPLPDWRDRWWGHDSDLQPVAQAVTQACCAAAGVYWPRDGRPRAPREVLELLEDEHAFWETFDANNAGPPVESRWNDIESSVAAVLRETGLVLGGMDFTNDHVWLTRDGGVAAWTHRAWGALIATWTRSALTPLLGRPPRLTPNAEYDYTAFAFDAKYTIDDYDAWCEAARHLLAEKTMREAAD